MRITKVVCVYLTLSTVLLTTTESSSCGSAVLKGPLDENGEPPARAMLLRLQASWTEPAVIRCQITLVDGEMHIYNPRLRLFLTEDGGDCQLFSHNDSRSMVDEECEGFHYTYYEQTGTNVMNFSYHILPLSPRINRSVVMCGVNPGTGSGSSCFEGQAALITIQDDTTRTTSTIKPSETSTGEPPTASDNKFSTILTTAHSSLTTLFSRSATPVAATPIADRSFTVSSDETPTAPTTLTEELVSVNSEVFISVVVILVAVGAVLLLANVIQLWANVKTTVTCNRAKSADMPNMIKNVNAVDTESDPACN